MQNPPKLFFLGYAGLMNTTGFQWGRTEALSQERGDDWATQFGVFNELRLLQPCVLQACCEGEQQRGLRGKGKEH